MATITSQSECTIIPCFIFGVTNAEMNAKFRKFTVSDENENI